MVLQLLSLTTGEKKLDSTPLLYTLLEVQAVMYLCLLVGVSIKAKETLFDVSNKLLVRIFL